MRNVSAYAKGVMAEDAACAFLVEKGMQLLDRRYRSPYGEIDLLMLDGHTLVIVEVKAREHEPVASALAAVTPQKQRRLVATARCYLGEHPEYANNPVRFDAIAIGRDGIIHIADAFQGSEW